MQEDQIIDEKHLQSIYERALKKNNTHALELIKLTASTASKATGLAEEAKRLARIADAL